jgi:membrane protease YdiL (CAAX protease family)
MREREPGPGFFGPPSGKPDRPFVEAALLLAAFFALALLAFAPRGGAGSFFSPFFQAELIMVNCIRIVFTLYVISSRDGMAAFGLRRLRGLDTLKGLFAAGGAFATMMLLALFFSAIGLSNPLMANIERGSRILPALAPAFLASSMSTGYAEELFFRSYLLRRLGQAGLGPIWAAIASSLLFGAAHAAQGIVGIVSTSIVGLWFAWRWSEGRNIHEIAIGHGLYDAAVFAVALYV